MTFDNDNLKPFFPKGVEVLGDRREFVLSDSGGGLSVFNADTGKAVWNIGNCNVKDIQRQMNRIGLNVGAEDGLAGPKTISSIRKMLNGLQVKVSSKEFGEITGISDEELIETACSVLKLNAAINPSTQIASTSDGKYFAAAGKRSLNSNYINVYHLENREIFRRIEVGAETIVNFALDSEAKKIAVAFYSGDFAVYDLTRNERIFINRGKGQPIIDFEFGKEDSDRLFARFINSVVIYSISRADEIAQVVMGEDGRWVVLTPAGYFAAGNGGEDLLQVSYGLEPMTLGNAYDALHRPDLVFARLAGDNEEYDKAARNLDLTSLFDGNLPPVLSDMRLETSGSDDRRTAVATLTARNGGIGKVVWKVNGAVQAVIDDVVGEEGQAIEIRRDLQIFDGDNVIEVVASTKDGRIQSNPVEAQTAGKVAEKAPRLHVAVVGVNDYSDTRFKLNFSVPDARAVAETFREFGKGIYDEVFTHYLLDGQVTMEGLDTFFAGISTEVRPSDVFVLFFAGHGVTIDGKYYFLPADFAYRDESSISTTAVGQDDLQRWMAGIAAQKALVMFDTCESGTLTSLDFTTRGVTEAAAIEKLNRAVGRNVIAAAAATEQALEGYNGHGVFTWSLLEAAANADGNSDNLVDLAEIIQFVDRRVPDIAKQAFGYTQVPQVRMQGSNFPLIRTGTPASLTDAAEYIPTRNTHVVVREVDVFIDDLLTSLSGEKLPAGTRVGIVQKTDGSALISKDGRRIGYVEADTLLVLN